MGEVGGHDPAADQPEKPSKATTSLREIAVNHLLDEVDYRDQAADRRDSKAYRRDMEANLRSFILGIDDTDAFEYRASARRDHQVSKADRSAAKIDRQALAKMLLTSDGAWGCH